MTGWSCGSSVRTSPHNLRNPSCWATRGPLPWLLLFKNGSRVSTQFRKPYVVVGVGGCTGPWATADGGSCYVVGPATPDLTSACTKDQPRRNVDGRPADVQGYVSEVTTQFGFKSG